MKDTIILGIESSCDETACAIVKNKKEVLLYFFFILHFHLFL